MRIVLDSNILFGALIKDSATRKLILEHDEPFLFPDFIFKELEKHKDELVSKSGMAKDEFYLLLGLLLQKVELVPEAYLLPYKKQANDMVKEIDPDDAMFVACTLAYKGSILWSEDGKLKRINEIKVMNTKEILMQP